MKYQISSKLNKKTLKLYYGIIGRTELWGFKSYSEAFNFLILIK